MVLPRPSILGALLLVGVSSAFAELPVPRLVADLADTVPTFPGQQFLGGLPTREGLVFAVSRLDSGLEIWGTPKAFEPARLLLDVCPLPNTVNPTPLLIARDGLVYFRAGCGGSSTLWVSDGSPAGTRLLDSSFEPDARGAVAGLVPESNEILLFGSRAEISGLWAFADPTTEPVKVAGLSSFTSDGPARGPEWAPSPAGVVFAATGEGGRAALWVSDGTASGTRRLAQTEAFARSSLAPTFFALGGRVVATARNEVWATDGSPAGTFRLAGGTSELPGAILPGTTLAFFSVIESGSEPDCWVTDGSRAGTRRTGSCATAVWRDRGYFEQDGQLWSFGAADSSPTPVSGLPPGRWRPLAGSSRFGLVLERQPDSLPAELWLLAEPGATAKRVFVAGSDQLAAFFGEEGGNLFFADRVAEEGGDEVLRLWRSNGTIGGTTELVRGTYPYDASTSSVAGFSLFASGAWWVSVGAGSTVYRFDDDATVVARIPAANRSSLPRTLQAQGGGLYAVTLHNGSSTSALHRIEEGSASRLLGTGFSSYRAFDQGVAYWTDSGNFDLWWLDESGSHSLYRTRAESYEFTFRPPELVESSMGPLFADSDGVFRLDPETARVETVKLLPLGSSNVSPYFARRGTELFFFHQLGDLFNEGELWRTDGTAEGTVRKAEVAGLFLAATPDRLFWFGDDGRLWTLPEGGEARRLEAGPLPRRFTRLQPLGNRVCLPFSREVWVSDGTEAGTRKLKDRAPTWRSEARTTSLRGQSFADRCFFVSDDPDTGHELWSTDGTVAGTRIVADLFPGPASSFPDGLTVIGDRLLFRASDGVHGTELWSTDGTAAGTLRLTDLAPGRASADPSEFTVWGQELAFVATDAGEIGREVWALPLSALAAGEPAQPPAPGGAWLTSAEVPGFRFKVRVASTTEGRLEPTCLPETACVSGALPGRPEVFLRVVGPKPNGFLWPTLVKFSTSEVEVWIEQIGLGTLRYYRLAGARPGFDELPALFDREGFWPPPGGAPASSFERGGAEPPPPGQWVTPPAIPGFRFAVTLGGAPTRQESDCLAETLCVSGAVPGRSEVFVRVVGPKPNGLLWPTLARFTTSEVEVWIEQIATGTRKLYRLEAAGPGWDVLTGLFDREGFEP